MNETYDQYKKYKIDIMHKVHTDIPRQYLIRRDTCVAFYDGFFFHRLDGPAIIWKHNQHADEWWINNKDVTIEIFNWAKAQGIDLDNLTEDDKIMIKLTWKDYGKN